MKKIFALLVAAIMCLSLFSACSKKEEEATPVNVSEINKELNTITVATIEGIDVTQAYYNLVFAQRFGELAQYYYGDTSWLDMTDDSGKKATDIIKESTKQQIEQRTIARVVAEKNGITITDEMKKRAKEETAQVLENYGAEDFLKSSHTTEAAMHTFLEEQYLLEALIEKLSKEGEAAYLTDAEIEESFYEYHKDKLRVQHILISTMPDETTGAPGKTDEEALAKANEVIEKLNGGADFDSLIPDYNEDPGMSQGKFYLFGSGEMVEEFEKESRELKVGEYSKTPVKTDYGYHIIKKYAIDTTIPEFEQYKVYAIQEEVGQILNDALVDAENSWESDNVNSFVSEFVEEYKNNSTGAMGGAAN